MPNKSIFRRVAGAAVIAMVGAMLALVSQPFASTPVRTDRNEQVFAPIQVALIASDEVLAPTS